MAKCKWCGQKFKRSEAEDEFDGDYRLLSYSCFRIRLCYDCACSAIDDEIEGVYFEECEECGNTFDYVVDNAEFEDRVPEYCSISMWDCWDEADKILCFDCAMDVYRKEFA